MSDRPLARLIVGAILLATLVARGGGVGREKPNWNTGAPLAEETLGYDGEVKRTGILRQCYKVQGRIVLKDVITGDASTRHPNHP